MVDNVSVVIECHEKGYTAYCHGLQNCHSQGDTVDQVMADLRYALDRYHQALPDKSSLAEFAYPK